MHDGQTEGKERQKNQEEETERSEGGHMLNTTTGEMM